MRKSNIIKCLCTVFITLFLTSTLLIPSAFAAGNADETTNTETTAYFILTQTITDFDRYQSEYVPQVLPFIAKYGGEIVVASHDAKPLQGNPAKGIVVIRFPSEDALLGFVNDPEYQSAKKLRIEITTNANAVLAPEFQMP